MESRSKINSTLELAVATWNINGGIHSIADVNELKQDLKAKKINIGCLQEAYKDDEIFPSMNGDGNLLFLRSKSYKGHTSYVQGFYISDDWINNLFGIKLI